MIAPVPVHCFSMTFTNFEILAQGHNIEENINRGFMLEPLHFFPYVCPKHDQNKDRGYTLELTSTNNNCFREEIRGIVTQPTQLSV